MNRFDFNDNVGDNNKTVRLGACGAFGGNEPLKYEKVHKGRQIIFYEKVLGFFLADAIKPQ